MIIAKTLRKAGILVILCFVFINIQSVSSQSFVKVKNAHFEINGKPYYFLGTNMWYACYLGSLKVSGGRERLVRELDRLHTLGIDNIRILGASEEGIKENKLPFCIQKAPGVYDEELLEGLDFALNEMSKRDQHAVIFLNNFWDWSGGMLQYLRWVKGDHAFDTTKIEVWYRTITVHGLFYSNDSAQELYNKYVRFIVNRKNKFNGLLYKNDPTIMSWQLSNEPRPGPENYIGDENVPKFVKWVDKTAALIKSMDQNHLVSAGSEGIFGCIQKSDVYLKAYASTNIDYLNVHIWVKNWTWFNPDKFAETYPNAVKQAAEHLKLHISLARTLNKPLVYEEFGIDRDMGNLNPGTPTFARDKYLDAMFQMVHDSASKGSPIVASNFWAWGGEGIPLKQVGSNIDVTNYVGDPFTEPQGTNSVFSNDSSTLKILKKHTKLMKELSERAIQK